MRSASRARVAHALEREDLTRELGQAQQPQQPQQAQGPQALQAGGQHRRGEEDDDQVERVVPQPGPRSGTTASITTSSTRKAIQVTQLRATATVCSGPPGFDSVIATVGSVSAAAISIGVFSRSAIRVLRSSIPAGLGLSTLERCAGPCRRGDKTSAVDGEPERAQPIDTRALERPQPPISIVPARPRGRGSNGPRWLVAQRVATPEPPVSFNPPAADPRRTPLQVSELSQD